MTTKPRPATVADKRRASLLNTMRSLTLAMVCAGLTVVGRAGTEPNLAPGPLPHDTTEVVLWVGDMPEARVLYEARLIENALARTEPAFGPFTLVVDRQLRSQERLARDLANDRTVHILSSPGWSLSAPEPTKIDTRIIEVPLVRGLQGYRQCIIRKENQAAFANINSLSALKAFSMGLGGQWLDKDIFDDNGFTTVEAPDIEKLYYMLKRGRFDCLPLGIGEAADSLAERDAEGELTIADNLLLFYPLPVFVHVGGRNSELARRIEQGLALMQQDGSFDAVFWKHHDGTVMQLRSPGNRVFRLHNPFVANKFQRLGEEFVDAQPERVQ